jgi:hypothetical protein
MSSFGAKLPVLRQKSSKIGHTIKQLWQPNLQVFIKMVFCLRWLKDQVKILKIALLSYNDVRKK